MKETKHNGKMIQIKVHHNGLEKTIATEGDVFLLQILRDNGFKIYAPCGGNGTCGKCTVWQKGEGAIASCLHYVTEPLDIVLPDEKEAKILVEQHEYTRNVPFNPGPAMMLSYLPHGIALDLGTTTMVFYLMNLITGSVIETKAVLNPQGQFGGDVISRISHASEKEGGLDDLQKAVLETINEQLEHFVEAAGITKDEIVKFIVSGNTTMLHLLLGVDPLSIALAPFTPAFTDAQVLKGKDLKLHANEVCEVKTLPSISAYVGADIVSGIASIRPEEAAGNYLFMDLGTNGELAVVTREGITCCATAAGPALEGARISCGMGAAEGAISEFYGSSYKVIGDAKPVGICGSGLIDIVAWMLDNDLIDDEGLMQEDFVVAPAADTAHGKAIVITQQDIREVQLAKAAIAAGVNILLKETGLTFDDIGKVFLAGGFGNYINPVSAMRIGLISPEAGEKIIPLGNTSGTGAVLAVKSVQFEEVVADVVKRARYIELSDHDDFTLEFAMNMMFEPVEL